MSERRNFLASTPAAPALTRKKTKGTKMLTCIHCHADAHKHELHACYSCGVHIHPLCISPFISATGSCICTKGCNFLPLSSDSNKRGHMELSLDSRGNLSMEVPDRVAFSDFSGNLTPASTLVDFSECFSAFFNKFQEREDIKTAQTRTSIQAVESHVQENTESIKKLNTKVERHENHLSLFELTIAGIHGENLAEIRRNFIAVCSFLKVGVQDADIVNVRFLKMDKSNKKVRSHNVVVRLHCSKNVSLILNARKTYKPLKHVDVFPDLTATDRNIFIRPMLTEARHSLLQKALEAKRSLNYKFCWCGDYGTIYLKKNESSQPIIVRDANSLIGLEDCSKD